MDCSILLAPFMRDGKLHVELRKTTVIQSISYGKRSLLQEISHQVKVLKTLDTANKCIQLTVEREQLV